MKVTMKLWPLLALLAVLASACAPAATATPAASPTSLAVPEDAQPIFADIQRDLALRAEVELGGLQLAEVERVEWPDAGLGCPHPDRVYAQVVTPGYRFVLETQGESYEYHPADEGFFVLCDGSLPQEPVIEATDPS